MGTEGRLNGRFRQPKGHWGLQAPHLEGVEQGMLDPAADRAVLRVEPYLGMASGDRLTLSWRGIDADGGTDVLQMQRFVSCAHVGKPVLFVVRAAPIAALEGGSVVVDYTVESATLGGGVTSPSAQWRVGDPPQALPAARVDEASSGWLSPERFSEGGRVTIRPYAMMAVGDTVFLTWQGSTPSRSVSDSMTIESHAVGGEVSFWIDPHFIASNLGSTVTFHYTVQRPGQAVRHSEPAQVQIGVREPRELTLPQVLEADKAELAVHDTVDGVTVVIDEPSVAQGDGVYLKCDGIHFSHRDNRDVMDSTASVFIVPYRFWREHQDSTVQVSYRIERQDDTSEASGIVELYVRSGDPALSSISG